MKEEFQDLPHLNMIIGWSITLTSLGNRVDYTYIQNRKDPGFGA